MATVKAYTLRGLKREELETKLNEFKTELSGLRVIQASSGAPAKLAQIKIVRKNIARALTVLNQTKRAAVRKQVKGKKYIPTDMRAKKTRAMRRALTQHQATKKTLAQLKKRIAFPTRKFALKA
ncbi:hypothetical protein WA158_006695 [Blastocystis sp. Blastoise]